MLRVTVLCMPAAYSRKSLQLLRSAGMAELPEGLRLDLSYALPGDAEVSADLFEGAVAAVLEAEPELEDPGLAVAQRLQHIVHLLLEELVGGRLGGSQRAAVLDEVPQVAILLLADGGLQGDRLLGYLEDLADLLRGHLHAPIRSPGWWARARTPWTSRRVTRRSLLIVSTMWTGIRMVRAWSAMALVMACLIHQVA